MPAVSVTDLGSTLEVRDAGHAILEGIAEAHVGADRVVGRDKERSAAVKPRVRDALDRADLVLRVEVVEERMALDRVSAIEVAGDGQTIVGEPFVGRRTLRAGGSAHQAGLVVLAGPVALPPADPVRLRPPPGPPPVS